MPAEPQSPEAGGLGAYVTAVVSLDVVLTAAGVVYGGRLGVAPTISAPIIIAFLVQAALFLLPGFPGALRRLEQALAPGSLAAVITALAVAPYLIYSIPLGLFSATSFLKLLALGAAAPVLFVVFPPKREGLTALDVFVIVLLASPLISGLTDVFREIFPSPDGVPRLDILGKLMVIWAGAAAFLSLRRLDLRFHFFPSWKDLKVGGKHFLYYLPIGAGLSLATGLVEWGPRERLDAALAAEFVGTGLGIFFATALGEELCFRGILQNLLEKRWGKPLASQAIATTAFGAVHLSFRYFPNWRFALASLVAGWFYGNAFREQRSVEAARVTHTLTVLAWTFLFRS